MSLNLSGCDSNNSNNELKPNCLNGINEPVILLKSSLKFYIKIVNLLLFLLKKCNLLDNCLSGVGSFSEEQIALIIIIVSSRFIFLNFKILKIEFSFNIR